MHQFVHTHEIHVQAAQQKRLQEAILAEQIKLAGAPSRFAPVRIALGALLITFGERLTRESAPLAPTDTTMRRVAATA